MPHGNKGRIQRGKHAKGLLRPHVWKSGEDAYKHQMYIPWLKMKAQCNYRKEQWNLPFEDYYTIWNGYWDQRGRATDNLCMTRTDYDGVWELDNIELITRADHCRRQAEYKMNAKRKRNEANSL